MSEIIIGESIGVDLFVSDALEVMNILIQAMEGDKDNNDMTFEYILPACARISKALERYDIR